MGLVTVRDEWTKLVGHRFLNSQLCLWIGLVQAIVCMWGVAQHCHSVIHYRKILHCDFLDGSMPLEAADAVIFDIGLFHSLWGIRGCVAEYLDGGFGRLAWCVSHIISLAVSLPFAFVSRPRPCFLWPLLIQQSAYGIGLLILLIAALPRILPQLMEPHAVPVVPISVYIFGTMLNFFLLYVYWHWYWHVASLWGSAVRVRFGRVVRNANNRSRRDRPMIPKEEMLLPEALDAEALRSTAIGSKEVGMRRDSSSVSRAFKEAQEQMNGAVPNGGVREKSPQPAGNFLEVPAVSKTVRARYPQEPPVIRAMLKRGKEETGCKTEAAKKRALYKQRSSKVTTDQRRPSQSSARRRSSASTTADDASPCRKVPKSAVRPNGNPLNPNNRKARRRQSNVTINSDALVIEPTPSGASTPSPAPPPIIATRLSHNAYENRMLREQEGRRLVSRAPEPRTPRRRLPKTPSGTPCGEIPRPPRFYLPSSEI